MDVNLFYVAACIACVFLSSFFSATETALTSLSEAKTHQLIESKRWGTRALNLWLKRPSRVLTSILIYNCSVNTLCAALGTVVAQELFGEYAVSIATGVVTLAVLVVGEVTPKTFARQNAVAIAPITMTMFVPFYWLTTPVVTAVSWLTALALRLAGRKPNQAAPLATEEDIAFMIRLGHQEGVLAREEGEMLESVIEFRDTLVKEVMVPRTAICAIEQGATLAEVRAVIKEHGHSRWPISKDNLDNVIGLFNVKDLLERFPDNQATFKMSDYIRPALFVPEMMKVSSVLKEFRHGKTHLAVVVDEYGGTAGIITLEDVLEELVGEIRDEYDDEEDERVFRKISDDEYVADGHANADLLAEALKVEFSEEEHYESLAGFLISVYGRMPAAGTTLDYQGWRFIIEDADEKRIVRVLIHRLTPSEEKHADDSRETD